MLIAAFIIIETFEKTLSLAKSPVWTAQPVKGRATDWPDRPRRKEKIKNKK